MVHGERAVDVEEIELCVQSVRGSDRDRSVKSVGAALRVVCRAFVRHVALTWHVLMRRSMSCVAATVGTPRSSAGTHTHARTHTYTHTHTHARAHARACVRAPKRSGGTDMVRGGTNGSDACALDAQRTHAVWCGTLECGGRSQRAGPQGVARAPRSAKAPCGTVPAAAAAQARGGPVRHARMRVLGGCVWVRARPPVLVRSSTL